MNKADNIYWDSFGNTKTVAKRSRPRKTRTERAATAEHRTAPWWVSFVIVTSIFVMLGLSINYRAFTEMREEADQNGRLSTQIQNLMDENIALQEEIHTLKTDPRVIEREAKRIGMSVQQQQVPVPAN